MARAFQPASPRRGGIATNPYGRDLPGLSSPHARNRGHTLTDATDATTPPEPPITLRPLTEYASACGRGSTALKQHWGGDPVTDDPERLPMLEAFCGYANRDPDQIIKETTMIKDGEKRIRLKGRERFSSSSTVGRRRSKARASARVKPATPSATLIHNGVLLASGMQGVSERAPPTALSSVETGLPDLSAFPSEDPVPPSPHTPSHGTARRPQRAQRLYDRRTNKISEFDTAPNARFTPAGLLVGGTFRGVELIDPRRTTVPHRAAGRRRLVVARLPLRQHRPLQSPRRRLLERARDTTAKPAIHAGVRDDATVSNEASPAGADLRPPTQTPAANARSTSSTSSAGRNGKRSRRRRRTSMSSASASPVIRITMWRRRARLQCAADVNAAEPRRPTSSSTTSGRSRRATSSASQPSTASIRREPVAAAPHEAAPARRARHQLTRGWIVGGT